MLPTAFTPRSTQSGSTAQPQNTTPTIDQMTVSDAELSAWIEALAPAQSLASSPAGADAAAVSGNGVGSWQLGPASEDRTASAQQALPSLWTVSPERPPPAAGMVCLATDGSNTVWRSESYSLPPIPDIPSLALVRASVDLVAQYPASHYVLPGSGRVIAQEIHDVRLTGWGANEVRRAAQLGTSLKGALTVVESALAGRCPTPARAALAMGHVLYLLGVGADAQHSPSYDSWVQALRGGGAKMETLKSMPVDAPVAGSEPAQAAAQRRQDQPGPQRRMKNGGSSHAARGPREAVLEHRPQRR